MSDGGPYQIVVGVDGSDTSEEALNWAIEEAQLRGAELTAVFAWQTPLVGVPGAFDPDELEQQAKKLLAAAVATARPTDGLEITQVVAHGDPTDSLLAACEQYNADLLVLGSRGRGGVSAVVFGSVGLNLAAKAQCPVLIVKSRNGTSPHRQSS